MHHQNIIVLKPLAYINAINTPYYMIDKGLSKKKSVFLEKTQCIQMFNSLKNTVFYLTIININDRSF